MTYTLGQAAKATGKTKPTLLQAIKKGRFTAVKNELGQYAIDPAELHRVYPPIGSETDSQTPEPNGVKPYKTGDALHELTRLSYALEAVQRERDALARQVEDAHEERDRWIEEAANWRLQAQAYLPAPKPEYRGLFARLRGLIAAA